MDSKFECVTHHGRFKELMKLVTITLRVFGIVTQIIGLTLNY